jgi:ketosteroid isomerase-like protein
MKTVSIFLLVAGGWVSGCSRASFDREAEAAALLKRDAEWAEAASTGKDVERILSFWGDDALVLPPGQPLVEGKEAIRAFVAQSLKIPGFKIHWVSEKISFSPDGQLAYMRGTNETTLTGPDGKLMTVRGRGITVWRRDPDGQWRCIIDIWNEPPPSTPSTRNATP